MKLKIAALLAVLGVAACSGAPTTGTEDVSTFYTQSLVSEATRDGAMPLVVHGDPASGLRAMDATKQLVREISLPGWFASSTLRASGGADHYRLVLIFNPVSIAAAANHPCGPLDGIATAPSGAEIRVVGAFCAGDRSATMNTGKIMIEPGGNGRAELNALVRQIVYSLFPAENRNLRNGDDRTLRQWGLGR